ncbi:hypothetical protein TSUD_396280 [Trifolium subterraneum]|uniref:glutathione transferase n=1 Tax=Trifolium subterraneum TaxID=3900 RepID=A0A2Z6N460_TRISU|nr:hypothetical protein TSUD_396280 [Trifolium subterraneum]
MAEVKLHGFWYSPFTLRVVLTLKLKGIPYENIEEDRFNKSPQLLEYNPVHKKTPVLVHDGKPLCESMIIVEYIDEIWPQYPLLPIDPYERAQARFWVKYADDIIPAVGALFSSRDVEERKNNIEKIWEHLKVVEEQCFSYEKKLFGGDTINIVDIAIGSTVKFLVTIENIIELKILDEEKFPHLYSWFNNFKDTPIINENLPDQEKMVASIIKGIQKSSGAGMCIAHITMFLRTAHMANQDDVRLTVTLNGLGELNMLKVELVIELSWVGDGTKHAKGGAVSQAPASSPKSPTKTPTAPSPKPLVPKLPESPDSTDSVPDDITRILVKAKTFSVLIRLLKSTEIMSSINSQLITAKNGGLTILAPDDSAFSSLKAGFLNSLDENKKIELLQFHILPQYVASSNFDSLSNPVQTVAGKDPTRLPLNVNALGNNVSLQTGVVNASIVGVVYSDNKLAIYQLDKVLLPLDFFKTKAPALAPSLAATAKAPKAAAKENSSSDDKDENDQDQGKSGTERLCGFLGTTLVSLVVVTMM